MLYSVGLKSVLAVLLLSACAREPTLPEAVADSGPPDTDIYIADLSFDPGTASITNPKPLIVDDGYDNQPVFLPGDDILLYVSEGPSGKTDLWQIDLSLGQTTQITNSPDRSEYSPRLTPDGGAISFIQEPPEGDETELYALNIESGKAAPFLTLKPLGYYALMDQGQTALAFLRSEPPTLQRVDTKTSEVTQVAQNIGRALYSAPDGQSAFFTTARKDSTFLLHRYDMTSGTSTELFTLKGNAQDYAVFQIPGGESLGFICAVGSSLYFRSDSARQTWQQIADLRSNGIKEISRLNVNAQATQIAIVTGS